MLGSVTNPPYRGFPFSPIINHKNIP